MITKLSKHITSYFSQITNCKTILRLTRITVRFDRSSAYGCRHRCVSAERWITYLDGRLVARHFRLNPLVLLAHVLHASQVTAVVVRAHQQLLLPATHQPAQCGSVRLSAAQCGSVRLSAAQCNTVYRPSQQSNQL